jgi:quercetin dioxygenase-like cupin family protein
MFKKSTHTIARLGAMFFTLLVMATNSVFAESPVGIQRSTLLEKPVQLPSSDIKAKVIRVTFPPAFKTPMHTHEGPGPRYVVKGQLKVSEKANTGTYSAGQVFWETGEEMTVENIGSGAAEIIIFELAPGK